MTRVPILFSFISLAAELAVLVYETIIENFPTDAKLTSDILNICSEFDNEWIESLKEKIVGIHKEKYTQNPVANLKVLLEVNRIKSAAFQEDDITDIEARFKVLIESLEENFKQQEENNEDEEKVEEYKAAVILELQKSLDSLFSYIKQLRQDHSENFGTFFSLIITSLLPQNFNNQRYFPFFNGKVLSIIHS